MEIYASEITGPAGSIRSSKPDCPCAICVFDQTMTGNICERMVRSSQRDIANATKNGNARHCESRVRCRTLMTSSDKVHSSAVPLLRQSVDADDCSMVSWPANARSESRLPTRTETATAGHERVVYPLLGTAELMLLPN